MNQLRTLPTLVGIFVGLANVNGLAADPLILPKHVESTLDWFPTDTETIIVATFPKTQDGKIPPTASLPGSLATSPVLKELDGLLSKYPIDWAIHGGRNFVVASSFGTLLQDGASIIHFAQEFSAEQTADLQQQLLDKGAKMRELVNREVFAFPINKAGMDSWAKVKPWHGRFVTFLNANTIIKSSSDRYLTELLKRIDTNSDDRPLPMDLPQWEYVNTDASVWLLRDCPEPADQENTTLKLKGLVWNAGPKGIRMTYFPRQGKSVDDIARRPFIDQETKQIPELLSKFLVFDKGDDGTVTFSFGKLGDNEDPEQWQKELQKSKHVGKLAAFSLFFIYSSQGIRQ